VVGATAGAAHPIAERMIITAITSIVIFFMFSSLLSIRIKFLY
jgi:hypothetical protein